MVVDTTARVWIFTLVVTATTLMSAVILNFVFFPRELLPLSLKATAGVVLIVSFPICLWVARQMHEKAILSQELQDLVNRDRLTVMGHSAGGHLTQMMMATDWPARAATLPADMIKAGIPVSPLSYLEPVRLTIALNANLRMDRVEAEAESPMTNHPPLTDAPQLIVVGGAETDEFHRQSQMYLDTFGTDARAMEMYVVPGVDHFDELNVLADPASPFFAKTCAMLGL